MQRWLAAILLLLLAASAHALAAPAHAQPAITEARPEDGAVLDAPPEVIHLCFSEPVEADDPELFEFSLRTPEDYHLGLRIVFQAGGGCVDIYPGQSPGLTRGMWTFDWQVTGSSGASGSGSMQFEVTREVSSGSPRVPVTTLGFSLAPVETPAAAGGPSVDADGDGPDILFLALVTTGSLLGAAFLALILYLLRRRTGFWLHRPPPREGGDGEQH